MDAIDRKILAELQEDAHLTNQQLAARIGLSPSPTLRRVRRLKDDGIIARYVAVVEPRRLGLQVMALVTLTLASQDDATISAVEERIRSLDEVTEAYTLAGQADYIIKVWVSSLETYEEFVRTKLRTVRGLASITTMFAYATVKPPSPISPPPPHAERSTDRDRRSR
ncbi:MULTISPECIES: Lrp/AsnC family transcriptional regulator [Nocardioides]|uniref:Lrp/AsnC family transcriptional regulator n=1 Tax=Nocardioides vastitatis TaxID=2568655 RepID=A0ABW0ZLL1_9ACTN|nr:Lrp/AsnC family transcriptional regulator [Nocardioides sp.]